jgi:hypothetical protein
VQLRRRAFSSDPVPTVTPPKRTATGASIVQRLASFAVGAGLTALATQYLIFEEIRGGNQVMLAKQQELEKRLLKLETTRQ